ncbi:unnamed protein product [Echinostoma caproni]|uniref:OB domain-containing protein n=1 Tax=Echinostoma caproni TaxID=27848 RepID=A0A183BBN7_9TREM|nr:unnamed protein product [Echinostoma caproni]
MTTKYSTSPLLMCKVLIAQIISERRPYFDELREKWHIPQIKPGRPPIVCSLVWLQGTVRQVMSQKQFFLDDATGCMQIECHGNEQDDKAAASCPKVGEMVAVIGNLKQPDCVAAAESNWKVTAKTVIRLTSERQFDSSDLSVTSSDRSWGEGIAELSWPLEVCDMADHFYPNASL